ncbi:MAG: lysophospholipid acyltransferase family protein [Candidatus Cryptobacteroides sp.]
MSVKTIRFFIRLLSALPLGVHYFNSHIVAWIARVIVRYRKAVVEDNIAKAFPELDRKAQKKIVKDFYLHFGQIICETIWFGGSSRKRIRRSHIIEILNPEELSRVQEIYPTVMILTSHSGNWELFGGIPFCNYTDQENPVKSDNSFVVYLKQKSEVWNEVFKINRTFCLGNFDNIVETSQIMRHMVSHMGEKNLYLMITDQWPYAKSSAHLKVNFMGRRTLSMNGGAAVAHKYGCPVSFLSFKRRPGGKKYYVEFKPICDDASKMSVQEIMDRYYALLEEDIRQDPGNYIWSHRRWKKCE